MFGAQIWETISDWMASAGERLMSSPEESEFSSLMKEGECREAFTEWKNCVDKAKNKDDVVEKCLESASALTKCMEAHDPVLRSGNESGEEEKSVEKEKPAVSEEEEEECGLCLFMKGGGCKDAFVDWEKCVQEAEKEEELDVTKKCIDVIDALRKCMLAHSDYYEPILRAEKAAQEKALRVLEKESASESSDQKTQIK